MKSYKTVLNEAVKAFGIRKLTTSETDALKRCMLEMYDHIERICSENDLHIMLLVYFQLSLHL